jgi:hydroxymethylpyrimidine/phosphomethylpyrimidine kinase
VFLHSRFTPCALTIAGLDPGGGAGIIADLRAFAAAGAFGCAVVAVQTVQSTRGLSRALPVAASLVSAQAEEVLRVQRVRVIKTGALGSRENVRAVADVISRHPKLAVVVDPVLLPSAGHGRLLLPRAVRPLRDKLLPRASLVTPNVVEAETLLGKRISSVREMREAARALVELGPKAALLKGGHFSGERVVDFLAIGDSLHEFGGTRLRLPRLHGGGCTLGSLIAGRLATREGGAFETRLVEAVRWARAVHQRALRTCRDIGTGSRVLVLDTGLDARRG